MQTSRMRRIVQMGVDSPLRNRGEVRARQWMWAGHEEASRMQPGSGTRRRTYSTRVGRIDDVSCRAGASGSGSGSVTGVVDAGRCVVAVYVLCARLGRISWDAGAGGDCNGRIIIGCAGGESLLGRGASGGVCGCCGTL
jgi:hypothetical protein